MSTPQTTNPDGNTLTTLAEPGTLIDEHGTETLDGHMVMTEASDGLSVAKNEQEETMNMGEVTAETSDGCMLGEQSIATAAEEEAMMVVDVDPLACPLSTYLSADEAVLSPSSGTPMRSIPNTPVTPRKDFLSAAENSPAVLGPGCDVNKAREDSVDGDVAVGLRRKVVGRRLAVVEDDGETQTPGSATSADEDDVLTAASSSKVSKTRNKGTKRGRGTEKDRDRRYERWIEEGSSEERKRKRKGKKRQHVKKDTPEELSDGKCGEPKGVVDLVFEDMTSSVLSGAILEWANRIDEIRTKSRNFQGKLSGEMKKCVFKIKEGTALLAVRAEASGDPQFLRMRNSELDTQLRETENENARLREQLRKTSLGPSPPRRKRRIEKADAGVDVQVASVDLTTTKGTVVVSAPMREEFPPLEQRPPRNSTRSSGGRVLPAVPSFSTAVCDSEGTETGAEAYFTQHINFLTAAREMERKRRGPRGKEQMGPQKERRAERTDRDEDRSGEIQDGARKVGPRIISNVQLAPPHKVRLKEGAIASVVSGPETEWRVALGGRRRRRGGNTSDMSLPPPPLPFPASRKDPPVAMRDTGARTAGNRVERRPPSGQQSRVRPPRPPVSSAVTITGKVEGFSYATALKNAREHIDLEALGIRTSRVRKAINGGLLIEVSGEDSKAKAEELVTQLQGVLKDSAVVSCPVKKRELRVVGFDESVTSDEIVKVLRNLGSCSAADIRIGPIRTMNNGLGMVWVQLPVAAAAKVVEEGRVRIGWTVARIELLKVRPLQCYRCWSYGHVQSTCRSVVDRRGACFRCGQQGHVAGSCRNQAHCAVCHDSGLEASHRLGGPQCAAQEGQDTLSSVRRPFVSVRDV